MPAADAVAVPRSWQRLVVPLLIVAAAAVVRLLFWNGPLGSDDVVYLRRALNVANGEWTNANYNGALHRLGDAHSRRSGRRIVRDAVVHAVLLG